MFRADVRHFLAIYRSPCSRFYITSQHQIRASAPKTSRFTNSSARDFTLNVNYRSHNGIVKCAAEIVKVIRKLWPDAIDSVGEERGRAPGPKPIFFGRGEGETAYEQFVQKAA
jgi:hypothetical protein